MMIQDDRTPEQKASLNWLVVGTDSFLSGWGQAKGGSSYAAWACRDHKHAERVAEWVKGRSDMKRVRIVKEPYRVRSSHCSADCVHLHIYVGSECNPEWEE